MILFTLAIGALLVLTYIYQLSLRPEWGLISFFGVHLLNFTFGVSKGVLGGFHLDPLDIVNFSLVVAGLLRTGPRLRRLNRAQILAYGYLLLLGLSFVRGLLLFGVKPAINETRGLISPAIGILYFMTVPVGPEYLKKYVRILLLYGSGLVAVAALATAGLPIGAVAWANADPDPIASQGLDGRVLPSDATSTIALCAFFALASLRHKQATHWSQALPLILFATAVYLRHRSVWTMLIGGVVALFFLDGKLFGRLIPVATVTLAAILGVVSFASALRGNVIGANKFAESTQSKGTLLWRIDSWVILLNDEEQSPLTVLTGKPAGSGYSRLDTQSFRWIDVQPHDEWVDQYLRTGLIGALLLFLFFARTLLKMIRYGSGSYYGIYPMTSAWVVVCVGALCYSITYNISFDMFALLGIANSILASPEAAHGVMARLRPDAANLVQPVLA